MNEIQRYDKEKIQPAIIALLTEALGHDHQMVKELTACNVIEQTSSGKEFRKPHCENYLYCSNCVFMRFRLAKSIFLLAYKKEVELHSVTITPKHRYSDPFDPYVETAFVDMQHELTRLWSSYIGGKEIKSVEPDSAGYSIWPHLHVIAKGKRKMRNGKPYQPTGKYRVNERPLKVADWENTLSHHLKCLPLSWFPRKVEGSDLADLENIELNDKQKADIQAMVNAKTWFKDSDIKMNQALFWGIFDFDIYSNKHKQIRHFLNSSKLHHHLKSLKDTQEQSDFVKAACDQFLRLTLTWKVKQVDKWLKIPSSQHKTFSRRVEKHKRKVLELLRWQDHFTWKHPDSMTVQQQKLLDIALKHPKAKDLERQAREALKIKKTRTNEILNELDLGTVEKRMAAQIEIEKTQTEQKDKS